MILIVIPFTAGSMTTFFRDFFVEWGIKYPGSFFRHQPTWQQTCVSLVHLVLPPLGFGQFDSKSEEGHCQSTSPFHPYRTH
jgi:hypothetical protein